MARLILNRALAGLILLVGAQLLLPPFDFIGAGSAGSDSSASVAQADDSSDVLSAIRERGYLRVAVKDNRPPLGFIDEVGDLSGFEIEIARQLAVELLGTADAVRFVPVSNVDRLTAVLEGQVDIAIAAITLTEPRRRLVNFSDPYYLDGTAFVVRPDVPNVDSASFNASVPPAPAVLEDLLLSKIAVLDRSSSVPHVRYLLPGAQLTGVDAYEQGQVLLRNGEVDAFAGDASVLIGWVQPGGPLAGYRLLPNVVSAEPLAIAFQKGRQYDTLQTEINRILRRWYAEEWLQAQADYWGLPSGILPSMLRSESPDEPLPDRLDE